MVCPGFKEKGLLRLLRVAIVIHWMLNCWLILNRVSPFLTLYSTNWMLGLELEVWVSVAPKTWGAPASVLGDGVRLKTIHKLLAVRPAASKRKTKDEIFRSRFLE